MKANAHISTKLLVFLTVLVSISGCEGEVNFSNQPPSELKITLGRCYICSGGKMMLSGEATDYDSDPLSFSWSAGSGTFDPPSGEGRNVEWTAPDKTGVVRITLTVTDGIDTRSKRIDVEVGAKFPSVIMGTEEVQNEGYPYILANTTLLEVPAKCSLTIGPGVRVIVDSENGGLKVLGKLFIEGNAKRNVTFSPNVCPGETGSWRGIHLEGRTAEGYINHLVAYAAKDCIQAISRARVTLDSCTISSNEGIGVGVYGRSTAIINGCRIWENSYGLDVQYSRADVTETSIRYNSLFGVYLEDTLTSKYFTIKGSVIANNGADGISIWTQASPIINGCSLFSNGLYAVSLHLYFPYDPIDAEGNFWGLGYDEPEKIGEIILDREDGSENSNAYVDFDPWLDEDPNF